MTERFHVLARFRVIINLGRESKCYNEQNGSTQAFVKQIQIV